MMPRSVPSWAWWRDGAVGDLLAGEQEGAEVAEVLLAGGSSTGSARRPG